MTKGIRLTATLVCFAVLAGHATSHADTPLFGLKTGPLTAQTGDYVLCPSRQFYDAAVEKGIDKTTFIYYTATLVESNDATSTVRSLSGSTYSLPNEMIVPIPKGQTAKIGDVLLTWWQSGSGMQRAIVVGGTPERPVVRYLDIAYENPSGAGKKEDTLKPDSFFVLDGTMQLGTMVAVQDGGRQRVGRLLAMDDESVLLDGFAGKLRRYDRSAATVMPLRPNLKAGDRGEAVVFGSLKSVTVKKLDEKIGRVFATYQFGRSEKERAFAFGEIRGTP
ncbi:MAG: hypothetical protein AAFX06_21110 [Planctomycetota bacterium]